MRGPEKPIATDPVAISPDQNWWPLLRLLRSTGGYPSCWQPLLSKLSPVNKQKAGRCRPAA